MATPATVSASDTVSFVLVIRAYTVPCKSSGRTAETLPSNPFPATGTKRLSKPVRSARKSVTFPPVVETPAKVELKDKEIEPPATKLVLVTERGGKADR